jgi:acetyl/propionyl-CoA carboxylase alpha subunit
VQTLLIANRGEIAIRIARAARELGVRTIAVHAPEDAASPHLRHVDEVAALEGRGAAAYLDIDQLVRVARARGCDAVHPGYGFQSENPLFASRVIDAGLVFVGPAPATLAQLGDKSAARILASNCGVPVARGSEGLATAATAAQLLVVLGGAPIVLKAVSGGGGRGMRVVRQTAELDEAWRRAASEAELAFGDGTLYVEEYLGGMRHVEVQILGDASPVRSCCCDSLLPIDTTTTSSASPRSLMRSASSSAISSNGLILILTPSVSTPEPSDRIRTRTL